MAANISLSHKDHVTDPDASQAANKTPSNPGDVMESDENYTENVDAKTETKSPVDSKAKFGLQRTIKLFNGISWTVGSMIGTGIFLTPAGVLRSAGSVGLSLIVWSCCGVLAMLGGLCYAELALVVGKSGGAYTFILESYSAAVAFMYLSTQILISMGSSKAVGATTSGEYLIGVFIQDDCNDSPYWLVKGLALLHLFAAAAINLYSVPLVKRVQFSFTIGKVLALCLIIMVGLLHLAKGNTEYLENAFDGTETNPGKIALSFYSGMWAYGGWQSVTNLTEEVTHIKRTIPLTICISVTIVTTIYVLTNISYFAVLLPEEIISSPAVALTWAEEIIPSFTWVISLSVAISVFGGHVGGFFGNSRTLYRAGRDNVLPSVFGMIHTGQFIPKLGIIYALLLTYLYLMIEDIQVLVDMLGFVNWTVIGACCAGVIVLRFRKKDVPRPFKVPLPIPIFMTLLSIYFVVAPLVDDPQPAYIFGVLLMFGSLVFYVPLVYYEVPVRCMGPVTKYTQLFLNIAPSETTEADLKQTAEASK